MSLSWHDLGLLGSAGSTTYTYDTSGKRLSKTVNGTTTQFYYAGDLLVGQKKGNEVIEFMFDSKGDYFGFEYNGTPYYYIKNLQGDVIAIYNNAGNKVVTYEYNAWGKLVAYTDTTGFDLIALNPIRYRSYYFDRETGFYYLKTRYYSPEICRFLSPDVILDDTGVNNQNLFSYCANNPVMREDSSGHFWETAFDVISLGASIVEVCLNPTDIWAWAGLVGDAVDLIPFVTGVGEITRAVKTTVKVVDKATEVLDAAKTIYKSADASSDIRKATGSYEILYKSGKNYIGKGDFNRAITSAKAHAEGVDDILSIRWKSAPSSHDAFIDEYLMQKRFGGVLRSNPQLPTHNIIWSPGRNYYGR